MLAYALIEIAERLTLLTRKFLNPIMHCDALPEGVRGTAKSLIEKSETLSEQIADVPDIDALHDGLIALRTDVEGFIQTLSLLK